MTNQQIQVTQTETNPNPAVSYLRGLRQGNTQINMTRALQRIVDLVSHGQPIDCKEFPWWKIEFSHAQEIKARLETSYKPSTINQSLVALRQVMKIAYYQHRISHVQYKSVASVKSAEGTSRKSGRYVTAEEIQALMDTCEDTPKGRRDAAIIILLFVGAGLRREELVNLRVEHYEPGKLQILGKGRKEATQLITTQAGTFVDIWLKDRTRRRGPIFCRILKNGRILLNERLTPHGVWYMLKVRAKAAGIEHLSPHDGRRTFISNLLEKADLATVQQLARHANPKTTTGYDRRADDVKLDALEALELPE